MYSNKKFYGTYHAFERAEERLDYSGERANRLFARAWAQGKRADSYTEKKSRAFLRKKSGNGEIAVFFGNNIFIFNVDTAQCVTCYPAPKWFGQRKRQRFYVNDAIDEIDFAA